MAGRNEVGVGLLVVGAAVLLGWMSIKIGGSSGMGDAIEVEALFKDVTGLQDGAAVTVAGVEVGRVSSLRVDGAKAVVGLAIKPEAGIREDVQVAVRARSLLGEKYVGLAPTGREAPLLKDGAVLTNTVDQVELTDLMTRLAPALDGLDTEQIERVVGIIGDTIEEDPERLKRMLEDAEETLENVRVASEEAPGAMKEARAAIAEVRSAVAQTRPMLDRADRVLGEVEGAISASRIEEKLPGMVEDAEVTLGEVRALAEALGESEETIQKILANLEEIDKWELRRLLREEGIMVRLRESEVVEPGDE